MTGQNPAHTLGFEFAKSILRWINRGFTMALNSRTTVDGQAEVPPAAEYFHSIMDTATQETIMEPARQVPLDEVMSQLCLAVNDTRYPSHRFCFNDLPRELRDIVYEHLVHDTKELLKVNEQNAIHIAIQDAPIEAMLNISSRFSKEYLASTFRRSKLIGEDCTELVPTKLDLPPDVEFKHIGCAEFKLIALCCCDDAGTADCNILDDIRTHRLWLKELAPKLVDIPKVEMSVLVSFCPAWKNFLRKGQRWPGDSELLKKCCEELEELVRDFGVPVESVKIYYHIRPDGSRPQQARYEQIRVGDGFGTWTRESGWVGGV